VARLGIVLIAHPCRGRENDDIEPLASELRDVICSLCGGECQIEVIDSLDKEAIKRTLENITDKLDRVIVIPLLVRKGSHFKDIESIIRELSEKMTGKIVLAPSLLDLETVRAAIVSAIVQICEPSGKYRRILEETGDPMIIAEIRSNTDSRDVARAMRESKIMITDDIRILTFIDIGKIFPGMKIMLEDRESFSYPPNSIVIICRRAPAIRQVLKNVETGLKPSLIIAVPPALSGEDIKLKREILRLDIPVIATVGSRGGPHVAGLLISSILGDNHERGQA